MKNKILLLFVILSFVACEQNIDDEPNPNVSEPAKFPFEKLDETYFKQASSQLAYPETTLRLDSIVMYNYYKFNPETGVSEYQWHRKGNTTYAPPPPEPTNRTTEVFNYDEENKLLRIEHYQEDSDNQFRKGNLEFTEYFSYDENNNLIRIGDLPEENNYYTEYYYNAGTLIGYKQVNSQDEYSYNIENNGQNIIVSSENYSYNLTIDSFKNITKSVTYAYESEYVSEYKYPKNIINPYYQMFPSNFISDLYENFIYIDGTTHFFLGGMDSSTLQLNEFYYPEIKQIGSYDLGYRTKYYYSKR